MARTFGRVADYVGRTFDLVSLRGAAPIGDVKLDQTLFGGDAAGEVCTGAQKLAQRWVLHFLTIRGSMPFIDRGTDFLLEARGGEFRTEADVVQSFAIAEAEVRRDMQNEEATTDPDDERIASAELLRIGLSAGELTLTVQVNSRAGGSRRTTLPIPYLPIRVGV